jgi:4-amino-4-deoxy-L-arabinose transferase-like glycosyltransferase
MHNSNALAPDKRTRPLPHAPVLREEQRRRWPAFAARFLWPVCLGGCLYLLFFHRLADRDLWSSHEARAAQNGQTLLDTGDWLLPRLYDNHPDLQKPPLYYWLVAGIARLRGGSVDAWAVRLPATLAAQGCLATLFLLGKSRDRRRAGLIAAAVLATALLFTWLGRVGRIDTPMTLAVTVALVCYYQGQRRRLEQAGRPVWGWFLMAYMAVGAAVLLKGPIGVVLPGTVVVAHLLVEWRAGGVNPLMALRGLGLWWGLPLVAVLTVPWFWWVNTYTQGEWFRVFFWYHNVERGFGSGKLAAHPWWFYGPRFANDFLPWSPLLLAALWVFAWRPRWRQDPEARFGLVWLTAIVLLLSCMKFKRADYLLPAFPGAALFLGCIGERWYRSHLLRRARQKLRLESPRSALRGLRWVLGAFTLVLSGTVLGWWGYVELVLPRQENARGYPAFAAAIRKRAPAPLPVILFRTKPHLLTFYLGRPVDTLLEWENLDIWAGRPGCFYVVMPAALAAEWPRHVHAGQLVEVLRSTQLAGKGLERELVLLRTQPGPVAPRPPGRGEEPSDHVRAR